MRNRMGKALKDGQDVHRTKDGSAITSEDLSQEAGNGKLGGVAVSCLESERDALGWTYVESRKDSRLKRRVKTSKTCSGTKTYGRSVTWADLCRDKG